MEPWERFRAERGVSSFDMSLNRTRSSIDFASRRFWFVERVWFWFGIPNWFSIVLFSSDTVVPCGFSTVTRSRPSRLRILSIIVFILFFWSDAMCDTILCFCVGFVFFYVCVSENSEEERELGFVMLEWNRSD